MQQLILIVHFERFSEPGWGFIINQVDQVEGVDGHANWSDPVMADIYRVSNVEVITSGTNFQRQHQRTCGLPQLITQQ